MTTVEKQFWKVGADIYNQIVETDSYIFRFYVSPVKSNIGIFYDKLMNRWDAARVTNGKIETQNIRLNRMIHQLRVSL